MSKHISGYVRYILILIAVVASAEYIVMLLFNFTGIERVFTQETEALADAFLLILLSSAPIYFWILKPILLISTHYQEKLENLIEALEGASDAVIITDSDGTISFVNRAFTTITGYSAEESIGKNPRILQSGKQSKAFYTMMWRAINTTGEWEGEVWNKRKNGEVYPELLHIKSINDAHGDVKFYIAVFKDITQKQRQEMMLRQSQKMEAIGILVGGVAHNFNNMLAGIMGKAYLAKSKTHEIKAIRDLESIEAIAADAAVIVKQLLSFAHAGILQKKNTLIVPLLKEAVTTSQLDIGEHITFDTHFSTEPLMVYCDPLEIQQVMINLFNNARDALSAELPRNISLRVERKLREGCARNASCSVCSAEAVHISITDSGCGIPTTDLEHIFDPFFTTKEVGEGTGLGLSMAKGAIESHGGTIHVSSTIDVGTTFEICLPITNTPVTHSEPKQDVIQVGKGETLLIIDDDKIVLSTLRQVLQNIGYHVLIANNGAVGVEIFEQQPERISLVISDVVMPVMDGPSAVKTMRALKANLPAIFITGYARESLDPDMEDELSSTLTKPFNVQGLSHDIHRLLQLSR